jgi:hypothetical protein
MLRKFGRLLKKCVNNKKKLGVTKKVGLFATIHASQQGISTSIPNAIQTAIQHLSLILLAQFHKKRG